MTENSPHQETLPFWLYIAALHPISAFLYVGSAQITCVDLSIIIMSIEKIASIIGKRMKNCIL